MKLTFKDSITEIYENENFVFGIVKDNSRNNYYNVVVREKGKKAKTIATRCSYNTALNLVNDYK